MTFKIGEGNKERGKDVKLDKVDGKIKDLLENRMKEENIEAKAALGVNPKLGKQVRGAKATKNNNEYIDNPPPPPPPPTK